MTRANGIWEEQWLMVVKGIGHRPPLGHWEVSRFSSSSFIIGSIDWQRQQQQQRGQQL